MDVKCPLPGIPGEAALVCKGCFMCRFSQIRHAKQPCCVKVIPQPPCPVINNERRGRRRSVVRYYEVECMVGVKRRIGRLSEHYVQVCGRGFVLYMNLYAVLNLNTTSPPGPRTRLDLVYQRSSSFALSPLVISFNAPTLKSSSSLFSKNVACVIIGLARYLLRYARICHN